MKTKISLCLLMAITISTNGFGQFSFGVSPGLNFNSAYFGYKVGKVVPYVGFQYARAKMGVKDESIERDWYTGKVFKETFDEDVSINLYVPHIGAKYFILERNKIQAYVNAVIAKPLISVNESDTLENIKDEAKKLSLWGAELGFGMEYFFDDNFSIGGEFGIKYLFMKYQDFEDEYYEEYDENFNIVQNKATLEQKLTLNFSPTYSKISFNYYF